MSYANHAIYNYHRRTSSPGPHNNDPWFHYQESVLRDLLVRLEVILEDLEIPEDKIHLAIQCMLYGSPHPPDAVMRVEQQELLRQALESRPPNPVYLSALECGVPPFDSP